MKRLMNRKSLLIVASAFALGVSACQQAGTNTEQSAQAQGTGLGIVPASMDRSVKPGDDFYAFANGSWMKTTEIPADRSNIGGFFIADQQREKNTRELLDGILKSNPDANSPEGKIANYY
jgi:putative endopeptidase